VDWSVRPNWARWSAPKRLGRPHPGNLGHQVAQALLANGADALLADLDL